MIARWLLPCALVPAAAFAQLQLLTFDGTVEKAATAITDVGTVSVGDSRELRFHVRNAGSASISLQSVAVAGQGFSISSAPSLPFSIAPSNFSEVRVRFSAGAAGSYSAILGVNSLQTLLRATVVQGATISVVNSTIGTILTSGSTLDFGRVQKGQSGTQDVRIANATNSKLSIQSCAVSGSAFSAPALKCPMSLASGDAITISLSFNPTVAAVQQGTLSFDDRTFALSGVGFDPPLPKPTVKFDAPLSSGTQQRLAIQLLSVPETSGSGTVSLTFQPVPGSSASDDPAVMFTSSGARTLSFQVKQGDAAGTFPTGVDTVFQTGTTAGAIVFRVRLGSYDEQFSFPVAPIPMHLDKATAARRVNDLDVSLTGFDNTRTAGRFTFTFFDTSGRQVQPGAVPADWTQTFAGYFGNSKVGGSFTLRATFPVSGDATQIAGVEVEMTNSAGTTRTSRIPF